MSADFVNLLDNYEMSTGVSETVTSQERMENHLFLDAILQTEVMKVQGTCILLISNNTAWTQPNSVLSDSSILCSQCAHRYLVKKGQASSDVEQFKKQLFDIWFRLYHRDRSGGWVSRMLFLCVYMCLVVAVSLICSPHNSVASQKNIAIVSVLITCAQMKILMKNSLFDQLWHIYGDVHSHALSLLNK